MDKPKFTMNWSKRGSIFFGVYPGIIGHRMPTKSEMVADVTLFTSAVVLFAIMLAGLIKDVV